MNRLYLAWQTEAGVTYGAQYVYNIFSRISYACLIVSQLKLTIIHQVVE
jgi:hypothetical protein